MNRHRDIIYKRRRRLLENAEDTSSDNLKSQILEYIQNQVAALVSLHAPQDYSDEEYEILVNEFIKVIPFDEKSQQALQNTLLELTESDEIEDKLMEIVNQTYQKREKVVGPNQMRQMEQIVTLSTIDEKWMDHLDGIESLREGIWLRGDKQTVLSEYKKEAFTMFEQLIHLIESTIASRIFRIHLGAHRPTRVNVQQAIEKKENINEPLAKEVSDATVPSVKTDPKTTKGNISDLASALGSAKGQTQVPGSELKQAKIGRNDPCPCGSGLKYKKCGLINASQHQQ